MHPIIQKIKFVCLGLALWASLPAHAQTRIPNMPEHDSKWYYFGITFGFNYASFRTAASPSFAHTDTFLQVQPQWGPGFNLGIMGNLKLSNFIDLRFIPSLVFSEKSFKTRNMAREEEVLNIESIYMNLPLQLKFKSDRIHNFRFYGLLGGKFDYDLSANARSRRQDEKLRVKAIDVGAEVGIGLEFYYPNFIFSPELKLGQGFINTHAPDNNIPLSNTIDRINSRMITFSIHLEG